MEKYWIYSSLHVIFLITFIWWLSHGTFQQTSTSVILILCNSEIVIHWSFFFYSLWREKNQNIKVLHHSAALSVFKSTRTCTTYLLDQHVPPFEFVIKSSSILIVWVFLVLGVVRFQQEKKRGPFVKLIASCTWEAEEKYPAAERQTPLTDRPLICCLDGVLSNEKCCDLTSPETQEQLMKEKKRVDSAFLVIARPESKPAPAASSTWGFSLSLRVHLINFDLKTKQTELTPW